MTRRAGATLLEVLVSIFIMGIGLLAILTLFPLGALNMAQAIKSDRAAALGRNGAAVASTFDLRDDAEAVLGMLTPGGGLPDPAATGPSYPVFIDPVGFQTYFGNFSIWVGGVAGVPRRPSNFVKTGGVLDDAKIQRWFTAIDDLKFGTNGIPSTPVEREGAYSYGLMFRRPLSAEAGVTDLAVVVYYRRPLTLRGTFQGAEFFFDETKTTFNTAANIITINAAGRAAPIRAGSWLLDVTLKGVPKPHAHAFFYRAASVTEVSPDVFEIEVTPPIRGFPAGATSAGRVVVMEGVIDVLERGTGWKP